MLRNGEYVGLEGQDVVIQRFRSEMSSNVAQRSPSMHQTERTGTRHLQSNLTRIEVKMKKNSGLKLLVVSWSSDIWQLKMPECQARDLGN